MSGWTYYPPMEDDERREAIMEVLAFTDAIPDEEDVMEPLAIVALGFIFGVIGGAIVSLWRRNP